MKQRLESAMIVHAFRMGKNGGMFNLMVTTNLVWLTIMVSIQAWDAPSRILLSRFHLDIPFSFWLPIQLMPSMYTLENTVLIVEGGNPLEFRWLNHHPTRIFHEVGMWRPISREQGCWTYWLTSSYRHLSHSSGWHVCRSGDDVKVARVE